MRKIALALAFLLCANPAWAALTIGTPFAHDQQSAADPVTFNYTVTAGHNLLVVACAISNSAADILSATYNSVAMTEIGADSSPATYVRAFYLLNPDTGSSLVVSVDMNGTEDGGCYAVSFGGAHATVPISGVVNQATSATNAPSLDVTCASGNYAMDVGVKNNLEVTTIHASQTTIMNQDDGGMGNWGSYELSAGATVTMSASWTTSDNHSHLAWCVVAAAAARRPVAPIIFQ